jgi:hypothetical protein
MAVCPKWAGGDGTTQYPNGQLDNGWIMLNFTAGSDGTTIDVDLTPLNGTAPTAVRYAWGVLDCCDFTDPTLYVSHGWYVTWYRSMVFGLFLFNLFKGHALQLRLPLPHPTPLCFANSIAECPIMSSSGLPANPFQAKIEQGKCSCVAPQVCDE